MNKALVRYSIAGAVVTFMLVVLLAVNGTGARGLVPSLTGDLPSAPGEPELFNLEHVFNFNPEDHDPGWDPWVGTDLEFFTQVVPLRDYTTGRLVDEHGNPLPELDEEGNPTQPVMAERDFAVMGSYQRGGYVFDITDPENAQFVTQVTCRQDRNDVAIKKFTDALTGEAKVVLALTQQSGEPCGSDYDSPLLGSGSGGVGVFDITDPYLWTPMYRLLTDDSGVHNFVFHPTEPYGYVSNGALPGLINDIPIVDFSDLDNPEVLTGRAPTEGGVHDIEFSPDGMRAYAASENNYRIYDTTDPANPVLLSRTLNVGSYAHGVFPTSDRSLMVTNNESLVLGGFLVEGTGVCPGEGLASYDLTDEGAPDGPLGYYTPNVAGLTDDRPCTSHFGRFAPGTRVLSMGWYIAGTRIVDWSDPRHPNELAGAVLEGTNTWAAKFHKGPYVYAGDLGRGFDVFRWSGDGPAPWTTAESTG